MDRRHWGWHKGLVAGMTVLWLAFPALAQAQPPEFLTRMPSTGTPGSEAGELDNPRGVAADPDTGRVFVGDFNNFRISEYTAWGLFVKSWGWGVSDGAAELQTCGPPEPEAAPDPSLCRKGIGGTGKGQFAPIGGVEVDGDGNVWVADLQNGRIQKFGPGGEFLLMLGGDVNKTKVEEGAPASERNVCPVDPSDVCQAGTSGSGPSELPSTTVGNVIAYSPTGGGAIVVGDEGEIQIFNLDGTYREEVPFTGALASLAGKAVNALDVDSDGNIYFSVAAKDDLYKLSPAGAPIAPGVPGESKFTVAGPLGVAVDHKGNVYVVEDPTEEFVRERVAKFDSLGNKLLPTKAEEEAKSSFPYIPLQGPRPHGIATNICAGSSEPGSLYVSFFTFAKAAYVDAYGSPPIGCEDPPLRAPLITAQYAISAGSESAKVQAQINPQFWPDATYYVEYGTEPCSDSGCASKAPLSPVLLTDRSVNKALETAVVTLTNLDRGTTYHYRFVAQSGGGGPVFGLDPDGDGPEEASFEAGQERTFRTLRDPDSGPPCANDSFRKGPAAHLPDCRAYEMVSPLDKEGGDVALWLGKHGLAPRLFELHQSALSGDRFAYSSSFAFADPQSAPYA
jgi:DNA-binding beta-propeller fold protein YncE